MKEDRKRVAPSFFDARVDGSSQLAVARKRAIRNVFVDAGQILVDHATRTEVHMPDFRVTHLPLG